MVRLSGSGAHAKLGALLRGRSAGAVASIKPNILRRYWFVDPATDEDIDDLTAIHFVAPRSYTGEDAAELYCHGGPFVVRRILGVLRGAGFEMAGPGEFTRRAFLNGKFDLTAAEGINELILAQSQEQWLAARQLASGQLKRAIDRLREQLVGAMALLAARIDFPDEGDTQDVTLHGVAERARAAARGIDELLTTYEAGRVAAHGLMVVMVGAPNVGKSTLLNTLLGRDRALVSDVAGTTRDYLEERVLIAGRLIRLVDTAGLRTTADQVEAMGVERSLELIERADIVLWLVVGGSPSADEQPPADEGRLIRVATKSDATATPSADWMAISCTTGTGLDELRRRIAGACDHFTQQLDPETTFITTERHHAALSEARQCLARYFVAMAAGEYDECLDFELQQAARALGHVIGAVDVEDILDRVFAEFCVGK